jgi:Kdo2-lipid IVA lauroyltransferase/acyltransferase
MENVSALKRFRRWLSTSWILYAFAVTVVYFLGLLPRAILRIFGKAGGYVTYLLDRSHRKLCFDNLAQAFPEKSHAQHLAILKKSYMHLAMCATDFCHFWHLSAEDLRNKWIVPEPGAADRAKAALERGHGVIAIGAHIGFWELSGFAYPTLLGRPVVSATH